MVEREGAPGAPARVLVEDLAGFVRRDALLRRFEATLTGSAADAPVDIEAEAGEAAAGKPASLFLDLVHGGGGHHARLQFQGFGILTGEASELKGRLELEAAEPPDLWRLVALLTNLRPPARLPRTAPILVAGDVELTPTKLAFSDVRAQLGPNTLEVNGELGFQAPVRLDLDIAAGELTTTDAAAIDDLRWLLELPWRGAPIEGRANVRFGLLRWHDQPIQQLRAELRLGANGALLDHLSASLPGTADLTLVGSLRPDGPSARFEGDLTLSAEDARGTLATLGVPPESLPAGGLRAVVLRSQVAANRASVALRNFELRADGSRLTGSAAFVPGVRPRFALSATADRLDLDLYRPPPTLFQAGWLRERLTGIDAALDLTVGRASLGDLWAEGLYLRASLEQGLLRVPQLNVRDLAEAQLSLSGSGDLPVESFQLTGQAVIARPARLLRALGLDPPPTITRFAPVRLTGSARGSRSETEVELDVAASGATGRLNASLGPWFEHALARATLDVRADRLEDALRNLGLLVGERPALARPAHLAATVEPEAEGYRLALQAEAPPADLSAQLSIGAGDGITAIAGKIESGAVDQDLLRSAIELAPPAFGAPPLQPIISWLGRLPETVLPLEPLRRLDLDLELSTGRLLGSEPEAPAGARLRVAEGLVTVDRLRLPLAGGTLAGVVTLAGMPAVGTLGLDLKLAGAQADRLLGGLGIAPALGGELSLGARLAASGRSMAELVGTLEGDAELELAHGTLPPLLPGAAPQPIRALSGHLVAKRGVLRSEPDLALTLADAEGDVRFRLDLAAWIAELAVTLAPPGPEDRAKTVTRRFVGPPDRLRPVVGEPEPADTELLTP